LISENRLSLPEEGNNFLHGCDIIVMSVKKLIKSVVGDKLLGMCDYYRFPELGKAWGGPFNGQALRQQMFCELLGILELEAIIETGTYLGTTSEYLYEKARVPIYTVEQNPRFFGFAKARLAGIKGVRVHLNDSRNFLRQIASEKSLLDKRVLFYLDAHWNEDLPLQEELKIIFKAWNNAVVMIDDFQVPNDQGYGFDDYGPGKTLNLMYLQLIDDLNLAKYFPSQPSAMETGSKRGCIILAHSSEMIRRLRLAQTLRIW
jgi:hypothetical protein